MRALLVGAGGMGQGWADNLHGHPEVELAAWVDVRLGAAREAAERKKLNVPYTGESVEQALREVDVDFVADVTPPEVHRDVTVAALGYGKPVIGEKPMAASMAQAREMVRASEAAGKLYMVSQSRRYIRTQDAYRELVGRLGRLGILHVDFMLGPHFGGFRDEMAHVLLLDMAIHTFDQARYLSGKNAVSVYAEEFNPAWSWYAGAASAHCLFEMEEGLRFVYRGSWCAEGLPTSWDGEWRAVGERGTAKWDGTHAPVAALAEESAEFFRPTREETAEVTPGAQHINASLDEFIQALKTGATPNGECHDNIQSLAMVFAAVASSQRGERVQVAEVLEG